MSRLAILAALLSMSACQRADDDPAKNPPNSVQDVASRVSRHAERKMTEVGLNTAEANSCFEKLNADMDVHPEAALSKVRDDDKVRLTRVEIYEKAFLDKCFIELRPH